MEYANLNQLFLANFDTYAEKPALLHCREAVWQQITYRELGRRSQAIASALLKNGCEPGQRAVIISGNRPEWAFADIGVILAGMISSALYEDSMPDEIAYVLNDLQATIVFVENEVQLDKVRAIRANVPTLKKIYVFDSPAQPAGDYQLLSQLMGYGIRILKDFQATIDEIAVSRDPRAPLCIIYTSGTTGNPKGVVLTHSHYLRTMEALEQRLGKLEQIERNLSFLPLAHAFERIAGHYFMLFLGKTIAYARSRETLLEDMQAVKPNFVAAVPRFFEKVHSRIINRVESAPPWRQKLFYWAHGIGRKVNHQRHQGKRVLWRDRLAFAIANLVVFGRIKKLFGGQLLYFVCGGAPLSQAIMYFFRGLDLLLLEGWGATEATAPCTINHPDEYRFGSVGKILPGSSIWVNADGEIEISGPNVFSEYWRMPEETAKSFTEDGFYQTGDLGRIDKDGWVYITGRKKQLIITAGGKNIAPGPLEQALISEKPIEMAFVHGDRRKYLTALLVLDRELLQHAAGSLNLDGEIDLENHPLVLAMVQKGVDLVNEKLPAYMQIKYFRVLRNPFSVANGQLTHTLKQKRQIIENEYRQLLDSMYPDTSVND